MNKSYLKKIFEENRNTFIDKGLDIYDVNDLENEIVFQFSNFLENNLDIEIDVKALFNEEISLSSDKEIQEIEI